MIRQRQVKLLEPLQAFLRSSWTRIGVQTKMSVVTITGLVALTGIFGLLAVAATRSNTDRALQERVILAQVAAQHMD